MNNIGTKIKDLRKKKGLSQEALAESAKVNLRTIQRIEKGESDPRGKTLSLICEVLEVPAETILDYGKQEDNNYLVFFHLSVLSFLVIPLGNIILPLVLWMSKKDKIIGLNEIGANLLNFQILWTMVSFFSITTFALLSIFKYGTYRYLFLIFIFLYLLNIILSIVFAIKARNGKSHFRYPTIIRLIK